MPSLIVPLHLGSMRAWGGWRFCTRVDAVSSGGAVSTPTKPLTTKGTKDHEGFGRRLFLRVPRVLCGRRLGVRASACRVLNPTCSIGVQQHPSLRLGRLMATDTLTSPAMLGS